MERNERMIIGFRPHGKTHPTAADTVHNHTTSSGSTAAGALMPSTTLEISCGEPGVAARSFSGKEWWCGRVLVDPRVQEWCRLWDTPVKKR